MLRELRYLFGGENLGEATPDLSYADHARRGFLRGHANASR